MYTKSNCYFFLKQLNQMYKKYKTFKIHDQLAECVKEPIPSNYWLESF